MKQPNHIKPILILLLSFLILTASGCSGGSSSPSASSSGTPKSGGSVTVGVTNEPDSLDPYLAQAAGTREILFNIFEGLVKPDSSGNMKAAVAKSWSISSDSKVYTFKLREGIQFQNGAAVTAQDVKYSLDRASGKSGGTTLVTGLENIRSVDITDSSTITVSLVKPDPDFLPYLSVAIMPKGYTHQNTKPIGTGPFAFESYSTQQQLVLKKNSYYWQKGRPYLDQVTFKIEPDTDSAFLELQSGGIDIFPYLSADKSDQLKSSYNILQGSANVVQLLALNNSVKPLNNIKVRQALSKAVDSGEIINTVGYGYGTKIGTGLIPGLKTYFNASLTGYYKKDAAAAKKLLAEAGYPNGFSLTITVPSNYQFHVNTAQVIVNELKAIGVKANIRQVDWSTWLSRVYLNRQYEATIIGLDGTTLSPRSFLQRYVTGNSGNFIHFSSSAYDTLYAKTITETSAEKRVADYKQLQSILTKEAASVYIQDPASLTAVKKGLGGYLFYPLYIQDMSTVYYTK